MHAHKNIVALPHIAIVWARIDHLASSEELSAMDRSLQMPAEEDDGTAPTWWDAFAAFYDDPNFVYGTPLRDLNPGPLARGPHPLAGGPQPAPGSEPPAGPETVSSSPSTPPRVLLWAAGALRLLGRWACDLTSEFAGLLVVRVTRTPSCSAAEARGAPIVLD